jgi:hypothetical protein
MFSRWTTPLLLGIVLCLGGSTRLQGQALGAPIRSWNSDPVSLDAQETRQRYLGSRPWRSDTLSRHSHTGTGLLIGGVVGAIATAVFLAGFCSDPDTQCGADEVGRAFLFIAVPTAAVGTLIGSLIRTKR